MSEPLFEPLEPDYNGKGPHVAGPDGEPQAGGAFGYTSSNRDGNGNVHGWSAGVGLNSGQEDNGARADIVAAQAHLGGWRDEQGRTNYGGEVDGAVARIGVEPGNKMGPLGFEFELLGGNAGAKVNEETASLGVQANIISGAVSGGNDEHNVRAGASLGVGAAGRAHYGDADNDGVREYGLGADIGPLSFDVKSELLGQVANGAGSAANAVGGGAKNAWDRVTSW